METKQEKASFLPSHFKFDFRKAPKKGLKVGTAFLQFSEFLIKNSSM